MGGCASKPSLVVYGGSNHLQKTHSMMFPKNAKATALLDYGAHIAGVKKDQDRYVIVPEVCEGVLLAGIFDGHGGKGPAIPERAAHEIPNLWRQEFFKQFASGTSGVNITLEQSALMVKTVFEAFQKQHTARYEKEILKPVLALKQKMEKETGVDIPLTRPPEGGTTATLAVIQNNSIHMGWVGDSKAVLGRMKESTITALDLSTEHNVDLHPEEVKRAIQQGGTICGKYVAVAGAEGMIQLLRSLGDCGHHQHGQSILN
jgi:serine/threonine protein phosphatase PrpC